jgi:hypothetical protein
LYFTDVTIGFPLCVQAYTVCAALLVADTDVTVGYQIFCVCRLVQFCLRPTVVVDTDVTIGPKIPDVPTRTDCAALLAYTVYTTEASNKQCW